LKFLYLDIAEAMSKFDNSTTTLLRPYQAKFSNIARIKSTIVVLPTGSGKTLIAAAVLQHTISQYQGALTLFLVPTVLLVEQQAASLRYESRFRVAEYKGGAAKPKEFDILVSTPAAFLILSSTPGFNLHNFKHIVFDEIHHVVKRHPYRLIARKLSGLSITPPPLILGLTASLTYAIVSYDTILSAADLHNML
jgi:endoribonuclease Dicer